MKNNLVVLSGVSLTFMVMLLFETVKEYLFNGSLSPWQSHWITIFFTSFMSLIIGLFSINKVLSLKEQELKIKLKKEKMKSIKQVMTIVHHHVNNLANNLQIVHIEIEENGSVSNEILEELNKTINITSKEMALLSDIKNPFDDNKFKIKL